MKGMLFLGAWLVIFSAHAEKIRVFDEVCVAEQIRDCISAETGCATGTQLDSSKLGNPSGGCHEPPQNMGLEKLQNKILACEIIGRSTRALLNKCTREIDVPSAAQIEALTKAFNDNFIKALEKAFPQPAAPLQPAAPSVQTK